MRVRRWLYAHPYTAAVIGLTLYAMVLSKVLA